MRLDRDSLVCLVALFVCLAIAPATMLAENEFFVRDQTLLAGGSGQEIRLEANSEIPFLGFSFSLLYDENVLTVTDVTTEGAMIPDPSFFKGSFEEGVIGYGCVFDFQAPFRSIPPGNDIVLSRIIVDVAPDLDVDTELMLSNTNVTNVITNEQGESQSPELSGGTLTIQTRRPSITAIDGNEGFAGDSFTVTGLYFDEPGLVVSVCGVEAQATLEGDTLTIVAPGCGTIGFAELTISTDRGSVNEPNGFNYMELILPVEVTGVEPTSGPVGTEITIAGVNFEGDELIVTICGVVDEGATLEPDGTIHATVPDCGAEGEVAVEVCQGAENCDAGVFSFTIPIIGTAFRRGDPTDSGTVNISSPIFILNFLFGGGEFVPACKEAADINNDGQVNVTDPVNLLNHLFGTGAAPAEPGLSECGLDPDEPGSAKDLGCDRYDSC